MTSGFRFGIVGTGMIAGVVAKAIEHVEEATLAGVASRGRATAAAFAVKHGAQVFDSWEALLAWDGIDAVYVSTPTSVREAVCLAAARHGKHLLADKPFASHPSVQRITAACREHGVAFMDATHFVHHPRTKLLKKEVESRIGAVQAVRTCFFFPFMDRSNIRFDPTQEPTGAIGDMGWYSMRAVTEFMPGDAHLASVSGYAERDESTGAAIRGAGSLVFSDGRTSTWDVGYNAGACVMDLDLIGHEGMIGLDDYVLDWAGGFAFDDPDYPVGFTQRSGLISPGDFLRVLTPSPLRQASIMIRDFIELAASPTGPEVLSSMAITERTQRLLDAVWAQVE